MADEFEDLDVATLEAKLAEASSYDERAALRKALRARKKQRGEVSVAVRRGASSYNRFRTSTTTSKQQQHQYVPPPAAGAAAGGGGGGDRKSPSATPARSNTPSSSASPTPLSPAPQSTSPPPTSPHLQSSSPLPDNDPIMEEQEEEKEEVVEEKPQTTFDSQSEGEFRDKKQARELEQESRAQARASRRQEQTDSGSSFGVQLRSHGSTKAVAPAPSKTDQSKAEFQGFKLRKTPSQSKGESKQPATSSPRAPADYRGMSSKPKTAEKVTHPKEHEYLVSYVNSTLQLSISAEGSALYDTCCNPRTICKLINLSVRNTVDMRALTKTPPPSKAADYEEAMQENMTLAVESARAIGCAVDDDTEEKLLKKDHEVFRRLLFDLIRAHLVNKPGMEDEPSSTFSSLPLMMEKLNLSLGEGVDGEEDKEEQCRWREADNDTLRKEVEVTEDTPASSSASWRETPQTSDTNTSVDINKPSMDDNLSYEERAAMRRAERERRRKEREALATAK